MNRRHRLGYYLAAFLLPAIVVTTIFALYQVVPFGERYHYSGDFFAQFYPFMSEFGRKLKNGGSMFYTWNLGLGSNFFAIIVYYLNSVFHLTLAFVPQSHILAAASIISILRFGLAGLAMYFYLEQHYKLYTAEKIYRKLAVVMSMFYALSPFMLYYFTFTMWMDVIILFPVVLIGIDRLIQKRKSFLYLITLTAIIMANYYMAIMVCIFCVVYFAVEYFSRTDRPFSKENRGVLVRFFGASLISGAINAVFIFPELFAILGANAGTESYNISRTWLYYDPADLVFSMLDETMGQYLFTSIFTVFAIPIYFMNRQVSFREKMKRGILFAFLSISFTFDICLYIFNGFHMPNGEPIRWAYIFVFLSVITSFEGFMYAEKVKTRQIIYSTLTLLCLYTIIVNYRYSIWLNIASGILFRKLFAIICYGIVMYLFFKNKKSMIVVLLTVLILESYLRTAETLKLNLGIPIAGQSQTYKESEINASSAATKQLLQEVTAMARVEDKTSYTANAGALDGYKSASAYTSVVNDRVNKFYEKMGLGYHKNIYTYEGATPVAEGILGVHYMIVREQDIIEPGIYQEIARSGEKILYKNPYACSIMYAVPQGVSRETWESSIMESESVFYNQNAYIKSSTGVDDIFTQLPVSEKDGKYYLTVPANVIVYSGDIENISSWSQNGETIEDPFEMEQLLSSYIKCQRVFTLKASPEERVYEYTLKNKGQITTEEEKRKYEENQEIPEPEFYVLNTERYKEAMSILNENPVEIENYTDDSLQGRIIMKENGWIMTSIPADRGWSISVDGKKIEAEKFADAFLCFPLDAGEHEITMKYIPAGFYPGLWITIAGLGAFLVWWCMERFGHSSRSKK